MDIVIPEVGESVREALVAKWLKFDGEKVSRDEALCEIETDKITLELTAEVSGALVIKIPAGETVPVGAVIGSISPSDTVNQPHSEDAAKPLLSPSVRKAAAERGMDAAVLKGSGRGGRVTMGDLLNAGKQAPELPAAGNVTLPSVHSEEQVAYHPSVEPVHLDGTSRVAMSPIRRRIAERMLAARQQTAMLTTFNEADLSRIIELRTRHNEHFMQKHGVKLGFMSFFMKACCEGLMEFPGVNASIEGNDIVYHHFCNIGVAIGAEKGLVVPVLRHAEKLHFHEIEKQIESFATKIKENRLTIADLEGGTFTISNGGVYGSLLSTPILNPPQSGVLGMHAIQERPVVRDGNIVIRPMMYLALSYDHRIVDGREAVKFLLKVKEYVEEPEELFLEG